MILGILLMYHKHQFDENHIAFMQQSNDSKYGTIVGHFQKHRDDYIVFFLFSI